LDTRNIVDFIWTVEIYITSSIKLCGCWIHECDIWH